jgi:hypothetical protein
MKIADFEITNDKKVFKAIIDAPKIGEEYFTIANSTKILPTVLPNNNQYLVLENEEWVLFEKEINDIFYKKDNCELVNTVFQKDIDLYTKIPPLKAFNGTIQKFNNKLQAWEYVEKGEILLEKERIEALEIAKKERLTQLQNDYNASKVIVIQNGETITIKHDTNEREHFWKNIELVSNETTQNHAVLTYRQNDIENNCQYRISLVPFVWQYLFNDLFLFKRSSGFKESIRSKNEGEYTFAKFRITNSQTIEGLNAVSYNFINPQGLIIDISAKATQMLDDINVSQEIKDLIRDRTQNGEIHLIEKFI